MDQLEELRPVRYAQVPHEALDTLPDLNSIGLLAIMLRHRPDFPFTVAGVIKQKKKIPGPKLGESAAYGAMTTLITHRWAARVKYKCAGGHFHTSVWRTDTPLTNADLRTIAAKYTAGTQKILHCKGCSEDPEIPVRTTIASGATLQGPWGDYEPIAELIKPGGRLADDAGDAPVPGIPGTGANRENTNSSQVAPVPGNRGTGARGTRKSGTFKKNRRRTTSSSSGDGPMQEQEEGSLPRSEDGVAVAVLDRALATWPKTHRRPVAAERARLAERIAAEIASGAEAEDVVYHLSRDLTPERVATTAVQVVMGRTKTPGWGNESRPASKTSHSASGGRTVKCSLHPNSTVPCVPCRGDYRAGEHEVLRAVLAEHGPEVRPDLAALLSQDACTA